MSLSRAIAFDAFGTLCDLAERRSPYLRMAEALEIHVRTLWRSALTQRDALDGLDVRDPGAFATALADLQAELDSFFVYPDTWLVLAALRRRSVPVAVVSNVSAP